MNALRLWFAGRSLRERRLLLVMAALAVVTIAWGGIWRPLDDALARASERQADAVLRLADTRTAVDAVHDAQAARGAAVTGSLADAVRASADTAGFTLASLDPAGPDRCGSASPRHAAARWSPGWRGWRRRGCWSRPRS